MAARERWLRGVGAELVLRGGALFGGGTSGVSALKSPDPEPEKEEVNNAPNIGVSDYCTTRIPDARDRRTYSDCPSWTWTVKSPKLKVPFAHNFISLPTTLHTP